MLTETFDMLSVTVSANGYPIVPIIGGEKRPAVRTWPKYVFDKTDSVKYKNCGIGILTGQTRENCYPITAIDIDILDPRLADDLSGEILARFGGGLVRVGKAPKSLIIYRAAVPGIRKYQSAQYTHGKIEVLGVGQQFVAFGIHPDTQAPYTYPGLLGSPEHVKAFDLPILSESDIRGVVGLYESLMDVAGFIAISGSATVPVASLADLDALDILVAPKGLTLDQAEEYLSVLLPEDRQVWINAGMALHHEFRGSPEALTLWDTWSVKSAKFVPGEPKTLWATFGRHTGERREITAGWLIKSAAAIKNAQEKSAKEAEYNLLVSDIDTCADRSVLLEQIAPRIATENHAQADRIVLLSRLRTKFKDLTGVSMSIKEAEAVVSISTPSSKYELTEVGNTARMVDKYGHDLIYVPESAQWYRWTGTRWAVCVQEIVLRAAEKAVKSILLETENAATPKAEKAIHAWYTLSQKSAMFDNMTKLAQMHKKIMRHADTLDCDTNYIGVQNGAVYLKTGDLIAPDKNLCLTLNTGVEYNPDATAPLFEQTLKEIFFDDTELCKFLQRLVGYSLLGHPEREEIVVLPEGRGANGKSTIFNAIHHALGTYSRYVSADTFCNAKTGSSGSGAREDVLRLQGARFCYVTELEENGVMRESFIKSMTGGESIPARGLYSRHTIEIKPTWIAFMPTNHLPIIKGEDKGIWRKICVLPFHRDFTADAAIAKDPNRKSALMAEAPGILRWAVEGCLEYQRIGLAIPTSIQTASDDYKGEMDLLSDWLTTCCECDPSYVESNADLWANWQDYAKAQGLIHLVASANALSRRLVHRGFERIKNTAGISGRGFRGIRLKSNTAF